MWQMMKSPQQGMAARLYMQIPRIQLRLNQITVFCIPWNRHSILESKNIGNLKTERTKIMKIEMRINKNAFWELITQGRAACGGDLDDFVWWLEDKLVGMGPEAALEFDAIVHAYYRLAYKYGLWNAASIMYNGCTDDGFCDFLGWLIAQGREVYMAALKDPDSLAELPACMSCWFPDIVYVGDAVYHRITGMRPTAIFIGGIRISGDRNPATASSIEWCVATSEPASMGTCPRIHARVRPDSGRCWRSFRPCRTTSPCCLARRSQFTARRQTSLVS